MNDFSVKHVFHPDYHDPLPTSYLKKSPTNFQQCLDNSKPKKVENFVSFLQFNLLSQ